MGQDILISIIIPVHSDPENLRQCLDSIFVSTYENYECIVVIDGADDDSLSQVAGLADRVVKLPENRGPAFARNRGAEIAAGKILFFIDSDVLIGSETLSEVVNIFSAQPDVEAVFGSYDDAPAHPSFISQYKNLFHHYVHQTANENAITFWAACGAIKRQTFFEAGAFDERFAQPSIEDIELGLRLSKLNRKILLQKQIQFKHLKQWTLWRLFQTDVFRRGIPWTRLMLRHKIFPDDLNVRSRQRFCVVLAYCAVLSLLFLLFPLPEQTLLLSTACLGAMAAIVILNIPFYKFYADKRGIFFAVRVFPLHLFYYFYCGLSFICGLLAYIRAQLFPDRDEKIRRGDSPRQ